MFEAVVAQARMLRDLGARPVVVAVRDEDAELDAWRLEGVETHLCDPAALFGLAQSRELLGKLAGLSLDCLHQHGIWQPIGRAAARWARTTGKPYLISPHGMLDPWITGRNRWKKRIGRLAWERRVWRSASLFHALTGDEAADIRREEPRARIEVVPNAAPPVGPPRETQPADLLYLGRIHPKKNIAALVEAWQAARPSLPPEATLTIAGWGDPGHVAELKASVGRADFAVDFIGPAFGGQKAALFDVARFLVLPSLSEGLPMAVLEAWAAGTPTIMSEACHLPEGFAAGAAIECGTDVAGIRDAIARALRRDDADWRAMSRNAQALAAGPFSRAAVARRWESVYASLMDEGHSHG